MEEVAYFFDSYAIVEITNRNENYLPYRDAEVTFTVFNLAEIYWAVLNRYDEERAKAVYEQYKNAVVELDDETIQEAMRFRIEHKKKRLSYADCIGYIYAKRNSMKFLTGDKEFRGLPNVEFVK